MALSPDGQTLASGGESIMLWDIGTRKHIAILKGHTESWFLHYAGVADSCPGKFYGAGV
jgi:WD40 repeat protein